MNKKWVDNERGDEDRQIPRRYTSHATQPTRVERVDEEFRYDPLSRLLAELRDQFKAILTIIEAANNVTVAYCSTCVVRVY